MTDAHKTIGDAIGRAISALGGTQRACAASMGVSDSCLSDLLRGRRNWNGTLLAKAALAVNLPKDELRRLSRIGARSAGWRIG